MFTRIVEIIAKAGKSRELANTIHEKVLPILKKQNGFVGETVLISGNRTRSHHRAKLLEQAGGCGSLPQ